MHVLTAVVRTENTREGYFGGVIVTGKNNPGTVSALEAFQVRRITHASCNQGPAALQMVKIQLFQRMEQVFTGRRSCMAHGLPADENDDINSKHVLCVICGPLYVGSVQILTVTS